MRPLVLPVACLCVLAAQEPSVAPAPTPSRTVVRAGSQAVQQDVVVRDKKGKAVRSLTVNDIQLLDEGNPAKITGLRLVTGGDAAAGPLGRVRLVSLVFEKLDAEERHLAHQASLEFLDNELVDNIYVGVFVADPRLLVVQSYSNDRNLLRQAVEQATGSEYAQLAAQSEAIRKKLEDSVKQPAGSDGAGGLLARITLEAMQAEAQLVRTRQWRSAVLALQSLAQEQVRVPGRKTLIYFADELQVPESMTEPFQNMIAAANHAEVSVYGIDTRGLNAQEHAKKKGKFPLHRGSAPAPATPPPAALETLSSSTGGFVTANTSDLRTAFPKIGEDIGAYYEVTYIPRDLEYDGRFRKIAVQVDQPDVKVQARSGYLALPANADSAFIYELPLLRAVKAAPAPHDFAFQSGALRFRPERGGWEYALVIEVPFKDITFTEDRTRHSFRAHLSLLALLKDQHGEIVDRFSRDVPLETAADQFEAFRRGNFVQTYHVNLTPGSYSLDSAVMDRENQKLSAQRTPVVVAATASGVAVSNLALIRRIEPAAGDADALDPFRFEGGKVVPTLDNSIQASAAGELSFYLVVYAPPSVADRPQLTMQFIKDGKAVGEASPELPEGKQGVIPYVASLPMANFGPGKYELRTTVKHGATVMEETAAFSINP